MSNMTDPRPSPYCFISYCRQEVTFADSFSRELEKHGIRTWVDFRNLVPGRPWQTQLDEAVHNADAILLVVSKASMSSAPVKDEWTKSLAAGRRIILIFFEPCKLDAGLLGLEWVDFAKNFDEATEQLRQLLSRSPQKATSLPPQRWKRLPAAAKKFMRLSVLLAFMSVIGGILCFGMTFFAGVYVPIMSDILWWSTFLIWLPAILNFAWLPKQIFTRTHNAQRIRNGLNALLFSSLFLSLSPVVTLLPAASSQGAQVLNDANDSFRDFGKIMQVIVLCFSPALIIIMMTCISLKRLLTSDAMFRWSGPNGAIIPNVPPDLTGHTANGTPLKVAVEFAPQDRLYAQELKASITRAGHLCTDDLQAADVVLPLLSVHKTDSACDPETTRLFPILLQRCDVDKRLSRVQWIDLRYGKISIDAVANLLDEPGELLPKLGVLPIRALILPSKVKWLVGLLTGIVITTAIYGMVNLGAVFTVRTEPGDFGLTWSSTEIRLLALFGSLLYFLLPLGMYILRRFVIDRRIRFLPFFSFWWALVFAVFLALVSSFSLGLSSAALWLVPLLMLHREIRLWLPPAETGGSFPRRPSRSA